MAIERLPIDSLIPYANNARTHSPEQVAQIVSSVKEFGWTNPVLIDEQGGIIAGHGRVLAARKLEIKEVPCIRLPGLTKAQKRAYMLADNKLALNAGWDDNMLSLELSALSDVGFNFDTIGFEMPEVEALLKQPSTKDATDAPYSTKIESPHYEPKGPKPHLDECVVTAKTADLLERIEKSNVPEEEKEFLRRAAQRHLCFDYSKVAEYYAQSNPEMQKLMEDSALVIIDFNDAIKQGYVKLTQELRDLFKINYGMDAEEGEEDGDEGE